MFGDVFVVYGGITTNTKMKLRKLTIVGYLAGLIIVVASIARWFVIYNDISQALFGVAIGIIVLGSSFVYQRLSELAEGIEDVNSGLDALNIWTRDEFKKYQRLDKKE